MNYSIGYKFPSLQDQEFLPPHVVDLDNSGYIGPHVDNEKVSGDVVAGLSLLSHRVMVLLPDEDALERNNLKSSVTNNQEAENSNDDKFKIVTSSEIKFGDNSTERNEYLRTKTAVSTMTDSRTSLPRRVEMFLPRRSFYILKGPFRYKFLIFVT